MRLVRRTVLTAVAVVLCVSPVAIATDRHENGGGAVIAPARGGGLSGGELLGEVWAQNLALPDSNDPYSGTCIPFARNVIAPHFAGETVTATCTATPRTRLFLFWGSVYTELDEPNFPKTEEAQLAEAVANDQAIHELNVTVDNGRTVNLVRRRFELFSPQRTAQLDDDNFYGVPARTVTFTAHAWGAVIRNFRPGQHIVTLEVVAPDWTEPFTATTVLNVVGRGLSHDGDHGDHHHGHGHGHD